jgi:hypothetical protein
MTIAHLVSTSMGHPARYDVWDRPCRTPWMDIFATFLYVSISLYPIYHTCRQRNMVKYVTNSLVRPWEGSTLIAPDTRHGYSMCDEAGTPEPA